MRERLRNGSCYLKKHTKASAVCWELGNQRVSQLSDKNALRIPDIQRELAREGVT